MKEITAMVQGQREYFLSGETKEPAFRIAMLKKLRRVIDDRQEEMIEALEKDFGKPPFETLETEIGLTVFEIDDMVKNLKKWGRRKKVKTPLLHGGAKSYIYSEPYGNVLVIGPWNYPFQLVLAPLAGAIAAGNCVIIKPSEFTPHSSRLVKEMLLEIFPVEYVSVIEGGAEVSKALLREKFDYIFFTGSPRVGKIVMSAAAKNLTPVTLELGGKSPCILDSKVNVEVAARRIAWGKFLNAGQTCIAPDYLLVPGDIKYEFLGCLKNTIREFYGDDPCSNPDYPSIINEGHYKRLASYLKNGRTIIGGELDKKNLSISPTVLDGIEWDDEVMEEEIFGPILPVITYETVEEAVAMINSRPKPLALYIFSSRRKFRDKVLREVSFGGGCINETLGHIVTPHLPFGGVGTSGMGAYHGRFSFDTFSHYKSVLKKPFFPDVPLRYPPYKQNLMKWLRLYFRLKRKKRD